MKLSSGKIFWCLALLGLLFFCNGLNHPLMIDDHVFFDEMGRDPRYLWMNFVPDKAKVFHLAGPPTEVYYRPLALIEPKLFYWLFGGKTFFLHLLNLVFFIWAAWIFAVWIREFSGNAWFGLLSAVFMLVHPLNGIIVNFNTAGIFALQLAFMLQALRLVFSNEYRSWQLWAIAGLFLAALFCHESAFILPLCATAFGLIVLKEPWPDIMPRTLVLWAMAAAYFLLRLKWASLETNLFGKLNSYHMSKAEHLASWFCLQWWYVSKFFAPQGIVISYFQPVVRNDVALWIIAGTAAWAGLIRAAVWSYQRRPWVCLGISWFLTGMVMMAVGSLFNEDAFLIEPHWFVFSSLGFYILLADLVLWIAQGRLKKFAWAACAALIAGWALWGWSYNALWDDERTYCEYWLSQSPEFRPIHMYIARSYFSEKKYAQASREYLEALTGKYPDYLMYGNLGTIALLQGHLDEAQHYLLKCVSIEPKAMIALNSLAVVYVRKGDWQKAEEYFKKAVEADPYDDTALKNLRMFYYFKQTHQLRASGPIRLE